MKGPRRGDSIGLSLDLASSKGMKRPCKSILNSTHHIRDERSTRTISVQCNSRLAMVIFNTKEGGIVMKKTLMFVMICMLVIGICSVACASWVSYSGKKLAKVTTDITPNVLLGTTATKTSSTQSGRHYLETCKSSNGDTVNNTQCVRMWRSDGTSVTGKLWHKVGRTYSMGVGSTTMLKGKTYIVKARGNTENAGQVTISGEIDADGGDAI